MATQELLRTALFQRALVDAPLAPRDPGEASHLRQAVIARSYAEQIGKQTPDEIQRAYLEELARPPDYRSIRRGSVRYPRQTDPISMQDYKAWLRDIVARRGSAAGLNASAIALPPITESCIRVADRIGFLATKRGTVVIRHRKLAGSARVKLRTVERVTATLAAWGYIEVEHTWDVRTVRDRLRRVQTANAYRVILTRINGCTTPPQG